MSAHNIPDTPKMIERKSATKKRGYQMKKLLRSFGAVVLMAFLAVSMSACGGGDGNNWFWFPTTPPDAPTGVVAIFNNSSSATVSWNAVADATSYNVYYAEASGVSKTVHDVMVSTDGTSYTFEGAEQLAVDTTYYFVVTAVKDSKESVESLEVSAKYTTFAQTDLEGTWNVTLFYTGIGVPANYFGWLKLNVTLDAAGDATINYYEPSTGVAPPPTVDPDDFKFTIDENGIVTQTGIYPGNTSHNVMSSNKELIIGTDTISGNAPDTFVQVIRIFQKAPDWGTMEESFSDADLANKSFVFHVLSSGALQGWAYGAGTIDAGLVSTISSIFDPTGAGTPPDPETLVIDPTTGVVTSTTDTNFAGVMTLDKNMIIGTTQDGEGSFQLRVIQLTDPAAPPTFTMGDLAGVYNFSSIFEGTPAQWQYGTLTINSSGVTSFLTLEDSILGPLVIPPVTLSMNAAGTITQAGDASFHGTMSANKELLVSTFTLYEGVYGLSLAAK